MSLSPNPRQAPCKERQGLTIRCARSGHEYLLIHTRSVLHPAQKGNWQALWWIIRWPVPQRGDWHSQPRQGSCDVPVPLCIPQVRFPRLRERRVWTFHSLTGAVPAVLSRPITRNITLHTTSCVYAGFNRDIKECRIVLLKIILTLPRFYEDKFSKNLRFTIWDLKKS